MTTRSAAAILRGVPSFPVDGSTLESLANWARDLRHKPDAIQHRRRHEAARHIVLDSEARSVLFVCHGNICRSPFAAAAFVRYLPPSHKDRIKTYSAGFVGQNRKPPAQAIAEASRRGLDLSAHRSALLTGAALGDAQLILVMDSDQARVLSYRMPKRHAPIVHLGDLDPDPIKRRTIQDPWNRRAEEFAASYERIDRCVRELAGLLVAVT